ncbi:hypothetical protein LDL36_05535 [Komagataeibacter sp. FNDCR1]|nr:hypothetical protein [Komagataeibacter sp. FNDCR1]
MDRDVRHRNPFYHGPGMPHPEDDGAHDFIADHGIDAWRKAIKAVRPAAITEPWRLAMKAGFFHLFPFSITS